MRVLIALVCLINLALLVLLAVQYETVGYGLNPWFSAVVGVFVAMAWLMVDQDVVALNEPIEG